MAEPRRTPFTTVGPAGDETDEKTRPPTIRFDLNLFDTTDSSCPEFSFADLMKDALPPPEDVQKKDSDDPFGDVDAAEAAKMAAIAQQFEQKYGPKPGKKKKKHTYNRYQDLIDLGDGYDETDPFVDNSEAYDEIVPACLTTRLGGFYINSGKLDFKEMSDDSLSEFQNKHMRKKTKKKRLLIDSDSDDEKKMVPKKNKLKDSEGEEKKRRKKHLIDGEQPFKKPKRPLNKERVKVKKLSPSVSELLKQQSESTSAVNGMSADVDMKSPPSTPGAENQVDVSSKLDNIIDSVISMSKDNDSDSREMEEERKPIDPDSIVKLPPGLSSELEQMLDRIKQAARQSQEGKCKFFTDEVNKMLLDIELGARQLPCGNRSTIYAHLAAFLPCAKETLLKRAKKLRLGMQDDKLKIPLQKLQDAITRVMPGLQQKYEAACQLYAQTKAAQEENKDESKEGKEKEGGKEEISTESDDEGKTNGEVKKKGNFGPRKKFEWNHEIKSLLYEIVKIKMGLYSLSKVRSQSPEEYVRSFLDREVKVLWPKGWIQTRMLYKESRVAHAPWTNSQKLKKNVLLTKPVGPAVNVSPGQIIKSSTNHVSTVAIPTTKGLISPAANSASVSSVAASIALPTPDLSSNKTAEAKLTVMPSNTVPQTQLMTVRKSPTQPSKHLEINPTTQGKRIATLLDYAGEDHSASSSQLSKSSILSTADIIKCCTEKKTSPLLSPVSKMSAAAVEKSFQHCISDLLRDALEANSFEPKLKIDTAKLTTPPKVTLPSSVQDSFLAQFQKYASAVTGAANLSKTQMPVQNQAMKPPGNPGSQYQMSSQEQALKMLANQAQTMKKLPTQGHSLKRLSDQGHPNKQMISPTSMAKQLSGQRMDHHEMKQARSSEEDKHRSLLLQQSAVAKQTIQMQKNSESRSLLQKVMGQPVQKLQSRIEGSVSVPKCDVSSLIHNPILGTSSHSLQSYSTNSAGRGLSRTAMVVNESLGRPSCALATSPSSQASHSQVVFRSTPKTAHTSQTSSALKLNLSASDVSVPNQSAQDLTTSGRESYGSMIQKYYSHSDGQKVSHGKQLPSPGLPSPGLPSPSLPMSITDASLPQMNLGMPTWSSLIGSSANTTVTTIGYNSQYTLSKPVPSYQNVKLSPLSRDLSAQSAMHIPSQVSTGGLPVSVGALYATPQGQLMVNKTSPVSKQTSSHSQGLYPPHTSPSRKYGTHYPESAPHGY